MDCCFHAEFEHERWIAGGGTAGVCNFCDCVEKAGPITWVNGGRGGEKEWFVSETRLGWIWVVCPRMVWRGYLDGKGMPSPAVGPVSRVQMLICYETLLPGLWRLEETF